MRLANCSEPATSLGVGVDRPTARQSCDTTRHPAFVSSGLFDRLPFAKDLLPDLTLEVDSIAEGVDTVGVEWHVQCGESAFPLGRGLSQARVCPETGKIVRVVDIAEAPWRVIGLLLVPFINIVQALMRSVGGVPPTSSSGALQPPEAALSPSGLEDKASSDREYELMMKAILADGVVDPAERALLVEFAAENSVSNDQHAMLLRQAGWSEEEYELGAKQEEPAEA